MKVFASIFVCFLKRCGSQPASPTASQGLLSSPSHGVLTKQVLSSSSREVLSSVSQGLLSTASQGLLSSSSQIGFRVAESDRISVSCCFPWPLLNEKWCII